MRYVIVNDVKDGNRMIRKANKLNKDVTVNAKCVTLLQLAQEVVVHSLAKQGYLGVLEVLDSTAGAVLLVNILKEKVGNDYFIPEESLSKETAMEVWNNLNLLRMSALKPAFTESEEKRISQIRSLMADYEAELVKRNQFDIARLYQAAVEILDASSCKVSPNHYSIVKECKEKLSALELRFLEKYTAGQFDVISLVEETTKEQSLKGATFFKSYGVANEVQYVLKQILEQKQKLGDVEILYVHASYESYIEAIFNSRKVPYAMVSRQLPVENEYFRVMKAILKWADSNYDYKFLKDVMVKSKRFQNRFYRAIRDGIGWGIDRYQTYVISEKERLEKETDSKEKFEQKAAFCNVLEALADAFISTETQTISCEQVFWKLVNVTKEIVGKHADYEYASTSFKQLAGRLKIYDAETKMEDVVRILSEEVSVLTYDDKEVTDAVSVQKIDGKVHVLERKHIYMLGMSSTHYSTSAKESPVLSDAEREMYVDVGKSYLKLAKNQETEKSEALYRTVMSRDMQGTLTIGYCHYDTVNLRSLSPSIPYLRMLKAANTDMNKIKQVGYVDVIVKGIRYNEESIWTETGLNETVEQEPEFHSPVAMWSTTSLQECLACPLKFYYHRIAKLPEEDYKKSSPDKWLAANERGTLAHGIMEAYCNQVFLNKKNDEIPAELQEELLDTILYQLTEKMKETCPIVSQAAYEMEIELVTENCKSYLINMHKEFSDPDNRWMVASCEMNFEDVPISFCGEGVTLKFRGQIDRLDFYVDDLGAHHYRIIDYKSGSRKRHEQEIESEKNVQHIVYAKAVQFLNKNVEKVIIENMFYVHFFERDVEAQEYVITESELQDFPDSVHEIVNNAIKKGNYDVLPEKADDTCKYCTYKDICKGYVGDKL